MSEKLPILSRKEINKALNKIGGPRRLHYFDALHVTTAKIFELPLITNDRFVLQNSRSLGITTIDLRTFS